MNKINSTEWITDEMLRIETGLFSEHPKAKEEIKEAKSKGERVPRFQPRSAALYIFCKAFESGELKKETIDHIREHFELDESWPKNNK